MNNCKCTEACTDLCQICEILSRKKKFTVAKKKRKRRRSHLRKILSFKVPKFKLAKINSDN